LWLLQQKQQNLLATLPSTQLKLKLTSRTLLKWHQQKQQLALNVKKKQHLLQLLQLLQTKHQLSNSLGYR
jgi:hypothetical protein